MGPHHDAIKHAGDLAATMASAFVVASQWAQLAAPIMSFLVGIASLVWWGLRYIEWFRTGKVEK